MGAGSTRTAGVQTVGGGATGATVPLPPALDQVTTPGALGRRIALSFQRLERYDSADTYSGNAGWPGDREGRVILAQAFIGRSAGHQSVQIDGLVRELQGRLNADGYMGEVLPDGLCDEQYLSGHSWLLRGLVEYQLWKRDALSRQLIQGIVQGLLLPCSGRYDQYPLGMEGRVLFGEAAGTLTTGVVAGWRLSTDIGCAFILLDGATAAWEVCPSPQLQRVIEEMIRRFRVFDPVATSAQTHATLSGLRGMLRWARLTGDRSGISFIRERYALYVAQALTDAFGNWNWFGRPLWTEPCAMVDALEVAYQLWAMTADTGYLDDVDHVLHNGLAYGQRPNGGFGCDCCVGGDGSVVLKAFQPAYEGPWCCTMRGAVGLARAASYGWAVAADDAVLMPLLHASQATLSLSQGSVTLERSTAYPLEGEIRLTVQAVQDVGRVTVRAFLPSWASPHEVLLEVDGMPQALRVEQGMVVFSLVGRVGANARLVLPMRIRRVQPVTAALRGSHVGLRHGPLVLGVAGSEAVRLPAAGFEALGQGRYRARGGQEGERALELEPINAVTFLEEAVAKGDQRCVLFPS